VGDSGPGFHAGLRRSARPGRRRPVELRPAGAYTVERRYVGWTNVIETVFTTQTGSVRITDALNCGAAGRLPWIELGRRVEGLSGTVRLRWEVAPGHGPRDVVAVGQDQ
jgi:hypothetical protein